MRVFSLLAAVCLTALSGFSQEFVTGQAARLVFGQFHFTSQAPGPPSQGILGGASGLAIGGGRMFVADASRVAGQPDNISGNNNRVMIYNNIDSIVPPVDAPFEQGTRCPACLGPADVVVGQTDFLTGDQGLTAERLRLPTAVATDGNVLVVADTNNNRVLIWRSIPTVNGQPADVVIGQTGFDSIRPPSTDQSSLRGPQGVWIHAGRLYIADTQNHRVLVYRQIPTQNNAPADIVIGQPNFTSAPDPNLVTATINAQNNTLLNPVSVTTDGVRLYVSDLGHNRVLIWNRIPDENQPAADVVLGQPNFTSAFANNNREVCEPSGEDDDGGNPFYPTRCAATLSFPRFALSDGQRLYVADGGNDRVLIWNQIPTRNAQRPDVILGQLNEFVNTTSDALLPEKVSASDVLRTPMSLALHGSDLYVSDTFNRRVVVFSPADPKVPYTGVRNAASVDIHSVGTVTFAPAAGAEELAVGDEITIKIGPEDALNEYKYTTVEDDSISNIIDQFVTLINANGGDPLVVATPNFSTRQLILTARESGFFGDTVAYSTEVSEDASITATTGGATLAGGSDAAQIAAGSIVTILGERLSDVTMAAPEGSILPRELGGVQVYIDGIAAPIFFVSPNQINAQVPWEVGDSTSTTATVRTTLQDGRVEATSSVAVPIIAQNPGLFARDGTDPRPGIVLHGSSYPTATVSVDGSPTEGNVISVIIGGDRKYSYTVKETDDLINARIGLTDAINNGNDPQVVAEAAGQFNRILLRGRVPGPQLNGVKVEGEATAGETGDNATLIVTAFNEALCCANVEGAPVTLENPAVPGERLILYATGLGRVEPAEAQAMVQTGEIYSGPSDNRPVESVSSLASGRTANVLFARLKQGTIGLYEVIIELNSDMPTNTDTQLTIAQSNQVSNIIRFPIKNPNDAPEVPQPEEEDPE